MRQDGCIGVLLLIGSSDCTTSLDPTHILHDSNKQQRKYRQQSKTELLIHHFLIKSDDLMNGYLKQRQVQMLDIRGTVAVGDRQVKSDQCMRQLLGQFIDIEWNIKTGVMQLSPTNHQSFSHLLQQDREKFNYIPFRHGANCPLLNPNIVKNQQRPMRPCSVVLLENKDTQSFLGTQRPHNISFGGKWVLPGGHLEIGQSITEGGIRECSEEVGLKKQAIQHIKSDVMVWESVYTQNGEVKSTGIVFFFRIQTKLFDVVAQQGEIYKWQWRSLLQKEQSWGGGWAQGHLTYLTFLSSLKS